MIITGAGRGLGRAYALAAARAGANVVVNDVDQEAASSVVDEIRRRDGNGILQFGSVAEPETAPALVDVALNAYGRVDALVNNAAILHRGPAADIDFVEIEQLVRVNVLGVVYCGTAAIRAMRQAGGGVIVNVTSGAHLGMPDFVLYGATKGAVASITYGWANECQDTGIRVIGFSPLAGTRMAADPSALPRPETIAPALVALLSEDTRSLNGQIVRFDGTSLSLLSRPEFSGPFITSEGWDDAAFCDGLDQLTHFVSEHE